MSTRASRTARGPGPPAGRDRTPWLLLTAAICTEVTASLALEAALGHPVWYLLVVAGYAAAFALLAAVLRRGMPVGWPTASGRRWA